MKSCANDLLALLNSILDTSKIESGKMQLQETEFNLAQLVEELADLNHPVGMKNCVEVVLDPCDGCVYSFSNRRLWKAQADTLQLVEQCGLFQAQVKRAEANLLDLTKKMKMDPNCIEFVFEVDDTGVGIPKDKHKTVFENFEQVNDVAAEVGGTGLGLGIVRSLVQLMGGDIEIIDKSSHKGTCFRFNVFLIACDLQMRTSPSCSPLNCLPNHFHNILLNNVASSERAKAPPPSPNNSNGSLIVTTLQGRPILLGISCVLLIVDVNAGEFCDLSRLVFYFKKDVNMIKCCKVVWLEKPETRILHFQRNNVAQADNIFIKPLHGSRLFQVIGHLPEFDSPVEQTKRKTKRLGVQVAKDPQLDRGVPWLNSQKTKEYRGMKLNWPCGEIHEVQAQVPPRSPFLILISEDHEVQKCIAVKIVKMMDVVLVEMCKNGKEALYLVCKGLKDQALSGSLEPLYHYILMDCQMPEMDGFESTRRIRIEEAKYGLLRIPIFALTAHESSEICESMLEAGMDAHLGRPLTKEKLVKAIRSLQWLNDG
ncbi:LOW QUALITY PROTEIN: hypothetical protein V2J09_022155 [Rumex salicifolius]